MFHGWDSFYLMLGSAAAALIGLLFVVATLTSEREAASAARGMHLYMTPIVFHLALIVVISALALAPAVAAGVVGAVLAASALIGFVYALVIAAELLRGKAPAPPHWTDVWFYAVAPGVVYLGLATAALLVWRVPPAAPYATAIVLVALLLVAIRNAWDLVTWLAPRRTSDQPNP
jgi:hypothetical protein